MTFPQGSTEHLSSSSLGSRTRLSPCRFDHNLWQMVNTAEAIRKSLSSLMEERVSALINIRPCSTFSHCKSSLVDLERVSTLRLRYQHRLKARDRLMCHRSSLGAQNPLRRRRPCIQTALNEIAAHTLKHRTLPPKLSHTVSLQDACKPLLSSVLVCICTITTWLMTYAIYNEADQTCELCPLKTRTVVEKRLKSRIFYICERSEYRFSIKCFLILGALWFNWNIIMLMIMKSIWVVRILKLRFEGNEARFARF